MKILIKNKIGTVKSKNLSDNALLKMISLLKDEKDKIIKKC